MTRLWQFERLFLTQQKFESYGRFWRSWNSPWAKSFVVWSLIWTWTINWDPNTLIIAIYSWHNCYPKLTMLEPRSLFRSPPVPAMLDLPLLAHNLPPSFQLQASCRFLLMSQSVTGPLASCHLQFQSKPVTSFIAFCQLQSLSRLVTGLLTLCLN